MTNILYIFETSKFILFIKAPKHAHFCKPGLSNPFYMLGLNRENNSPFYLQSLYSETIF